MSKGKGKGKGKPAGEAPESHLRLILRRAAAVAAAAGDEAIRVWLTRLAEEGEHVEVKVPPRGEEPPEPPPQSAQTAAEKPRKGKGKPADEGQDGGAS
jgi:hypothetical protein